MDDSGGLAQSDDLFDMTSTSTSSSSSSAVAALITERMGESFRELLPIPGSRCCIEAAGDWVNRTDVLLLILVLLSDGCGLVAALTSFRGRPRFLLGSEASA